MDSKLNRKTTDDPHDFVVVAPDSVGVAPSDEEISDLLRAAARQRVELEGRRCARGRRIGSIGRHHVSCNRRQQ